MQLAFPPELDAFIKRQLTSGKYRNLLDLLLAAVRLLQQQEDVYQGRLFELQQDALVGWDALQSGEVVDGPDAMTKIKADLRERYSSPEA
ncbi:MAG: type II toxin-antitoxin system ParD family antitoxin [Cyanobacteria bacterium J06648_16]